MTEENATPAAPLDASLPLDDAAAAKPAPALLVRIARLDADRVFLGLSEPLGLDQVKEGDHVFGDPACKSALPAGAVYVERDADNAPGRYRLAPPDDRSPVFHFKPLEGDLVGAMDQILDRALSLALAQFDAPAPTGRWARECYALIVRNFPKFAAAHAERGAAR